MDVVAAFLQGDLDGEEPDVYEQPEEFRNEATSRRVCQLKKTLYGLKQDSTDWNIKRMRLRRSKYDTGVYY